MNTRNSILVSITVTLLVGIALGTAQAETPQKRCGWFDNPTPGNISLHDRDGEWIIGIQGGHQAEGDWPTFKDSQWVSTNRSYGYGCACLEVKANQETHEITDIISASARPLNACRKDRTLKAPAN